MRIILSKKTGFLCLALLILSIPSLSKNASLQAPSPVSIYFFHAEGCQACQTILQSYLPTLKTLVPGLEVKTFDVGNPTFYEILLKLEKRFNRVESELPVVFIGDQMLSGEAEVMGKLHPLLLEYQAKGEKLLPPAEISTAQESLASVVNATSVDLTYFYQKGCPKCDRADALLKYILKKYPNLNLREIDLNTPDGKRLNETLSNRLQLPPEKRLIAPSLFVGNDYLSPDEISAARVEALIKKYREETKAEEDKSLSPSPSAEELKTAEASMIERFKSLGMLTVLSAGLIDGINPCAFATLIFFISYLTLVGRQKREIFWIGLGFSGAVFATYLLIGLGILRFIQYLSFLPLFSRAVYLLTTVLALILGVLSFYDFIQLKRGRPSEMKLQLPDFLKKRIHQTIRQGSRSTRYFFAAIAAGFVISLLEFACTGQVYLPTILFVTNIPSLRTEAVFYLFLYNFMFVVPLLFVFLVSYWGVTSEQLAFFLRKRAPSIRLLTSLFFFALAGILIFYII